MRYSKTHVNEIVLQIRMAIYQHIPEAQSNADINKEIELISEEHLLIDRRKSSTPEYRTEIVHDFLVLKYSYKDLMKKYHCSMRTVKSLLMECAEDDVRVYNEIEFRRH